MRLKTRWRMLLCGGLALLILFMFIWPMQLKSQAKEAKNIKEAREQMVERQIAGRDVKDHRVLEVMRKIARHDFVPESQRPYAYEDRPLPIGEGQTISQPYIVAKMSELLALKGDERVLEIGTGSGYQAAVLAELAQEVYTIEIVEILCLRAGRLLKKKGYDRIEVRCGDGYRGWKEAAPFDAIMVTAAPDSIPQALIDQLKPGGRMVIPVGRFLQELLLITKKKDGKITKKSVFPVRFVPMTGEAEKK